MVVALTYIAGEISILRGESYRSFSTRDIIVLESGVPSSHIFKLFLLLSTMDHFGQVLHGLSMARLSHDDDTA